MTTDLLERTTAAAAAGAVFGRVVAAVDGTEPGWEACRQAGRLVAPDGWIEVFAAVYVIEASLAGWSEEEIAAQLETEAGETIRRARKIAGRRAEQRLVDGPVLQSLLRELERSTATLAVVGTHEHSRTSEIVIGGLAGELLHKAPCSVLVARPPAADVLFPVSIVAGVDGSPESRRALAAARYLARRFDVPLRAVAAVGGRGVDLSDEGRDLTVETVDGRPVSALVEASRAADLVVLGSRGLHGMRALGSVSERVAHHAACSVLVVRGSTSA